MSANLRLVEREARRRTAAIEDAAAASRAIAVELRRAQVAGERVNVAHVAELCDVTRRTVYVWMAAVTEEDLAAAESNTATAGTENAGTKGPAA